MTHLFRILFLFCSIICIVVSCAVPPSGDVKLIKPFVDLSSLCTNKNIIHGRSRKLFCLICKGFDPSCFGTITSTTSSTSTSTTSTTTPASTTNTSTTPTTTTASTTSPSTTTTTTAAPAEK